MSTREMMHAALYDLFQCHDLLKDGDTFTTEFGDFRCQGIDVVPVDLTHPVDA